MAARSPRDGLARFTSAMILTRSAGASAAKRIDRRRLRECGCLDGGQRPLGGSCLGILNRAGREVGEHGQCSFAAYFEPLTP